MTNICGIKLTHDAAVAGISDGKLVFCVEIEKLRNNPRYAKMLRKEDIDEILQHFNFVPEAFVVDGWKHGEASSPAVTLDVASYHEFDGFSDNLMDPVWFDESADFPEFVSYPHISGHIIGSYVTSPFAKNRECCYIISWDGGQNPRVHYLDPGVGVPEFKTALFELYGVIYGIMGYYYGPYKKPEVWEEEVTYEKRLYGGYDVPGKLMSYIAQGKASDELVLKMMAIYYQITDESINPHHSNKLGYNQDGIMEHNFMRRLKKVVDEMGNLTDADVLMSVHTWLQTMLVDNACAVIPGGANLIFTGGSALNIKWNSALRRTGHFNAIYVPPFPNDSGSAIGAAACLMVAKDKIWDLDWSVYCGMDIQVGQIQPGWSQQECSLEMLAQYLVDHPDRPVVFLHGRAEVGPRALGNRSILCSAVLPENKSRLNAFKRREAFRPVAPICIEKYAPQWFTPGTPDPYMLFDHYVNEGCETLIPAVLHLDGTARLQTVNLHQNPTIYSLLSMYYEKTGIPLLCNTSANLNGSGFFPDVESAMRWPNGDTIWCNEVLYTRNPL